MDLTKLFEMQKVLDEKIYDRFPGLKEEPWDWKILALLTELGECTNEWRGFKKWSKDQEPRISEKVECFICLGTGDGNYEWVQEAAEGSGGHEYIQCENCGGTGYDGTRNPLLEEYVDCLHFILSIGLEIGCTPESSAVSKIAVAFKGDAITIQFRHVYHHITNLDWCCESEEEQNYSLTLSNFIGLGEMLGFTSEQIESAYFAKNEINHDRQDGGY